MTRYLFIRHASTHDVAQRLTGRTPGVSLNSAGRTDAVALARALFEQPLAALYSSPMERAVQTATPLAAGRSLDVEVCDAFNEVEFGEWTGRTFAELDGLPAWRAWNEVRSIARPPRGEAMADVLARALAAAHRIGARHEGECVAIVSHCDVIRPLLTHFLGMPMDHLLRLEVDTASVSTVELGRGAPRVLGVNAAPRLALAPAAPSVRNLHDSRRPDISAGARS